MSILDDLPGEIAEALDDVFRDAELIVPGGRVSDGQGGWINTQAARYPCKALVDDYSDYRRLASGIPANDRKIIVLAHGLPVEPKVGQKINAEGRDWQIIGLGRDPAAATFELQAR